MPRDIEAFPEVQPVLDERPDLSKPSLEGLAWLLRHPEEWAANHQWSFAIPLARRGCGTAGCAIGVARLTWSSVGKSHDLIPHDDFAREAIFFNMEGGGGYQSVTAEVVAGRIDDYLAGRPIRCLVAGDRSAAHAVPS